MRLPIFRRRVTLNSQSARMGGMRITKTDGTLLYGRVISSDDTNISFMLVGNKAVTTPRDAVAKMENEKKSLMFEGLLIGATDEQREALLDYLTSLAQV